MWNQTSILPEDILKFLFASLVEDTDAQKREQGLILLAKHRQWEALMRCFRPHEAVVGKSTLRAPTAREGHKVNSVNQPFNVILFF